EVDITGGTDVKWSPPIDYLRLVALPLLARMRVNVSVRKIIRGHYPRGGGLVSVRSTPTGILASFAGSERGKIVSIGGTSHVSNLPKHIAERQAESAANEIRNARLPLPEILIDMGNENRNQSAGSGILLVARSDTEALLGADCLGERGKPAEEVGRLAGRQLVDEISSGNFLDMHMGDIIVPYMALAQGVSDVSISRMTQHTITNVRVAEAVAGVRFDPLAPLDLPGRLRVNGIGWKQP
ncbi:MAG TPA: RNA 3'-terminal phosphate cyclase, partial [Candidatus Bathyarchaeia archaeon]|nr:RNA 3'-terminal phosphate cyclase [Candidatus Bathyarchaeia archaeon]